MARIRTIPTSNSAWSGMPSIRMKMSTLISGFVGRCCMGLAQIALSRGIESATDRERTADYQSTQPDSDAPTQPSRDQARDDHDVARVRRDRLRDGSALMRQFRDVVLPMRCHYAKRDANQIGCCGPS